MEDAFVDRVMEEVEVEDILISPSLDASHLGVEARVIDFREGVLMLIVIRI